MDRKNVIERKSTHAFLSNICFNKQYYHIYNNIISGKVFIDESLFIFLLCQAAFQVKFDGYFDEFYIDICKRRHDYIKQIMLNFRTAYLSLETYVSRFNKWIGFVKISNREIYVNHVIQTFDFDIFMDDLFMEDNEERKCTFITICNLILSQCQFKIRNNRVAPTNG